MIAYTVAALIGEFVIQYLWANYFQIETIRHSQFEQLLNEGKIVEATVASDSIQGA